MPHYTLIMPFKETLHCQLEQTLKYKYLVFCAWHYRSFYHDLHIFNSDLDEFFEKKNNAFRKKLDISAYIFHIRLLIPFSSKCKFSSTCTNVFL